MFWINKTKEKSIDIKRFNNWYTGVVSSIAGTDNPEKMRKYVVAHKITFREIADNLTILKNGKVISQKHKSLFIK